MGVGSAACMAAAVGQPFMMVDRVLLALVCPHSVLLLLMLLLGDAHAAIPFTHGHRNFGSVIRGAPLPSAGAVAFEHNCTVAPCSVTQMLFASVYPTQGAIFDWQHATISLFVDGEASASVAVTALELGWVSDFASQPHQAAPGKPMQAGPMFDNSGRPWGTAFFGHTAVSGGTYSTLRVPFSQSLRVVIQPANGTTTPSKYWFDIRGVEALPVILGDLELPHTARLKVHRVRNRSLAHLEMLTIAAAPPGTSGAILGTKFDATSHDFTFLEACPRFYSTADLSSPPMYLSSGAEDYFLSASYFDAGTFVTPESGLTFKDTIGGIGAFKMHTRDLLLFHDGMRLVWRNGDTGCAGCQPGNVTHAPCAFCPPPAGGAATVQPPHSVGADIVRLDIDDIAKPLPKCEAPSPQGTGCRCGPDGVCPRAPPRVAPGHALYSTLVYYYVWPTKVGTQEEPEVEAEGSGFGLVRALERLAALLEKGALSPEEFTKAKQKVLGISTAAV